MMRRMGRPGLLGTMARTAVVAGTASATVNAVNGHQAAGQQQAAEAYREGPAATDAEFTSAEQRLLG